MSFNFSDKHPEVELLGDMADPFWGFGGISTLLSTGADQLAVPAVPQVLFPARFHPHIIHGLFYNRHSARGEAVSYGGSDLHFPDN